MADHKFKNIAIKQADVDIEILPIIRWLNSFKDTITLYCCEGDDNCHIIFGDEYYYGYTYSLIDRCCPYVSMICWNKKNIQQIQKMFEGIKFFVQHDCPPFGITIPRITVRFCCKQEMYKLIERLPKEFRN